MTIATDIGIDKAVAKEIGKYAAAGSPKADGKGSDFGSLCKDGFDSALNDMRSTLGSSGDDKGAMPLPKMAGDVSARGGFVVCTFKTTLNDPMKQYADAMKAGGFNNAVYQFERLPEGTGYRISTTFKMSDVAQGQTMSDEERQGLAMMSGMIPREMTTSITIAGVKIANTDGVVAADGKSVTWKIPLHRFLDARAEAEPIKMTADVYFK